MTFMTQVCWSNAWSVIRIPELLRGSRSGTGERRLGIAPNILASRLESFVKAGLMDVRPNAEHKGQNEYVLTEKGRDFVPVIVALTSWGDRWSAPDGPPMVYEHDSCGKEIQLELRCVACNEVITPEKVNARPGPGFREIV